MTKRKLPLTARAKAHKQILRIAKRGRWPATLDVLAERVGLTKPHVSELMSWMRRAGEISYRYGGKGRAGRPPIGELARRSRIIIHLTKQEHARLKAYAGDGHMAELVRQRIADVIDP